mmetsp:Transcript_125878/g.218127  ORF Transcript_125878/g.218127 Transcript_125878/m.218127 type:complete len:81 (+) Transcript_125878:27-269(+)
MSESFTLTLRKPAKPPASVFGSCCNPSRISNPSQRDMQNYRPDLRIFRQRKTSNIDLNSGSAFEEGVYRLPLTSFLSAGV